MRPDKTMTLREAVAPFVRDGDTVAREGFTHLIPAAAVHEIIRQGRSTRCVPTPAATSRRSTRTSASSASWPAHRRGAAAGG